MGEVLQIGGCHIIDLLLLLFYKYFSDPQFLMLANYKKIVVHEFRALPSVKLSLMLRCSSSLHI